MRWALGVASVVLLLVLPSAAMGGQATVAPVVASPSFALTKCGPWCGFRDLIAPEGQSVAIGLRSTKPKEDVGLGTPRLVLQGEHHDTVITLEGKTSSAPLSVLFAASKSLPADTWQGSVLIDPSNGASEVAIPVTITVRDGPLLPMVALIGFVFIGFLLTWAFSARPKVKFKQAMGDLRSEIEHKPTAEQTVLLPLWQATWALRGEDDLTVAQSHLGSLQAGVKALDRARDIQDQALIAPEALALKRWVQRLGAATATLITDIQSFADQATYDKDVAAVAQTAGELQAALADQRTLDELTDKARSGSSHQSEWNAFRVAARAAEDAIQNVSIDPSQAVNDRSAPLQQVRDAFDALQAVRGRDLTRSEAGVTPAGVGRAGRAVPNAFGWPAAVSLTLERRFDFTTAIAQWVGPLASVAVPIVLLAVGFKITYLDNSTFGASLGDWLALAFWGLAAWGTRQTLTGLGSSATT